MERRHDSAVTATLSGLLDRFKGQQALTLGDDERLDGRTCLITGANRGLGLAVAVQIAEKAEPGSVILCMLPDTGERYLSTPLFESIESEMTEEEIALSKSTPGYQMTDA